MMLRKAEDLKPGDRFAYSESFQHRVTALVVITSSIEATARGIELVTLTVSDGPQHMPYQIRLFPKTEVQMLGDEPEVVRVKNSPADYFITVDGVPTAVGATADLAIRQGKVLKERHGSADVGIHYGEVTVTTLYDGRRLAVTIEAPDTDGTRLATVRG